MYTFTSYYFTSKLYDSGSLCIHLPVINFIFIQHGYNDHKYQEHLDYVIIEVVEDLLLFLKVKGRS